MMVMMDGRDAERGVVPSSVGRCGWMVVVGMLSRCSSMWQSCGYYSIDHNRGLERLGSPRYINDSNDIYNVNESKITELGSKSRVSAHRSFSFQVTD
jgi:hypothetical protein